MNITDGLIIGTQGIAQKNQLVLQALVRLLDGGVNLRARFSEQLAQCNVVFVSDSATHSLPSPVLTVRVKESSPQYTAPQAVDELSVSAPLRLSNVMAVLQAAVQRLHGFAQVHPVRSLQLLFELITDRAGTAGKERTVVPLRVGQQITIDFVTQMVHTATPIEALLSGAYTLGPPHRLSPVEEELIRLVPSYSLRRLVWSLALRLAQACASAPERKGSYRLLRWPDAIGLSAPGLPRLAALWTDRALSIDQACEASGASEATVRWFLEASLALRLAVAENRVVPNSSEPPIQQPMASTAPSWLGVLRDRLKLW